MGCIYLATNRINGKQYVGQGKYGMLSRRKSHESGKGGAVLFCNALRKHGISAFDWEVLYYRELLSPEKEKERLDYWEKYYIEKLNTKAPNGYNLTVGGQGVWGYSMSQATRDEIASKLRGKTISKEVCAKISIALKNNAAFQLVLHSKKRGDKISRSKTGIRRKPFSDAWKEKIGLAFRGKKLPMRSPEHCLHLSLAHKGKKHTEETRQKMSRSQTGRRHSLETKNKMSISAKGRIRGPFSIEARARMSVAHVGIRHTEETKRKMSVNWYSPVRMAKLS